MIFKKVKGKGAGPIGNLQVEFEDGFNLLYSEQKEKLDLFCELIQVVFYGDTAKKDSEEGSRPWIMGEIDCHIEGTAYGVKRKLNDPVGETIITDSVSGEKLMIKGEPGRFFCSRNKEDFNRTFFIEKPKTLGMGYKKKILNNLLECGDENLTYAKVIEALIRANEKVEGSGESGVLDNLKTNYQALRAEWDEVNHREQVLREEQIKYKNLNEKKKLLMEKINDWEMLRKQVEIMKSNPDYRALRGLLDKIAELTEQKELRVMNLRLKEGHADEMFIEGLKNVYAEWLDSEIKRRTREVHLQNVKKEIENHEVFNHFTGFDHLDEDIEERLLKAYKEAQRLRLKLEKAEKQKGNIEAIKSQLNKHKQAMERDSRFVVSEDVLEEINGQEEELRTLKKEVEKLQANTLLESIMRERWQKTIGIIVSPFLKKRMDKVVVLKEQIDLISENLQGNYADLNVEGYEDLNRKLLSYKQERSSVQKLESDLALLEDEFSEERLTDLVGMIEEKTKFLKGVMDDCGSSNFEEWQADFAQYKKYKQKASVMQERHNLLQDELSKAEGEKQEKENELRVQLRMIKDGREDLGEIEKVIYELTASLHEKRRLDKEINLLETEYQSMLQDRDIAFLDQLLQPLAALERENGVRDDENFAVLYQTWNEELDFVNKAIRETEEFLEKKNEMEKSLVQIEQEIEQIKGKIGYYERVKRSIFMAMNKLDDSHRELKDVYGLNLEIRTQEVLGKLSMDLNKQTANYAGMVEDSWDKVYFALRLGVILLWEEVKEPIPLIMNDFFMDSDELTIDEFLRFLVDYSEKHQVILLTSHDGIVEKAKKQFNIFSKKIS